MLKCQKKWLELFLKKFLLCTFRNNVESETVLYLTNGRKKRQKYLFLFKKMIQSARSYDHNTSSSSSGKPVTSDTTSNGRPFESILRINSKRSS